MTLKKIFDNHIIMSGVYKGISGLSLFVTIRLLMDYLGQDNYGLWVLVFTLFQLVLLMDFGIQSALKTKIPLLVKENKKDILLSYIKTTYRLSIYISIAIFFIFLFLVYTIDIKMLFNIHFQTRHFVNLLFILNIFFFCLSFIVNIHKSLYVAFLKGKYAEESIAVNQIGITVLIAICTFILPDIDIKTKLIIITFINGFFTLFVNLYYTIKIFKSENINLSSALTLERSYIIEILKLGSKYMFIQVGIIFIFSSDQYIISHAFEPSDVSIYEVVNKYFQFPLMIFIAALSPLWSMFTKDYLEKDKEKILYSFKKFNDY
jgi:O-antigen/teichoic acid export membrane protein